MNKIVRFFVPSEAPHRKELQVMVNGRWETVPTEYGTPMDPDTVRQVPEEEKEETVVQKRRRSAPAVGSEWVHRKTGNVYKVLAMALNVTDGQPSEPIVIYRSLEGNDYCPCSRSLDQFMDGRFRQVMP